MSLLSSPNFLRRILQADAASCIACGALQVALPSQLAGLFGLPAPLLFGTGIFLLAYAATVLFLASREPIPRGMVWLIVAGNFGWAAGCVALLVAGPYVVTALGMAYVAMQAATVIVLAELQWTALRRGGRGAIA